MSTFNKIYVNKSLYVKENANISGNVYSTFINKNNPDPLLYLMADGSASNGNSGLGQPGFYNYQVNTTNNINNNIALGYFKYNASNQINSTFIYINPNTSDDLDVSITISRMQIGNEILIQNVSDSNNYQIFKVMGVPYKSTQSNIFIIPVVIESYSVNNSVAVNFSNDSYLAINLQYVNTTQLNSSITLMNNRLIALEQIVNSIINK